MAANDVSGKVDSSADVEALAPLGRGCASMAGLMLKPERVIKAK
jgi:hypothetical protein